MLERHKAVPAVYLILRKGDSILLGRRVNTGYYDGWYTAPSGHVEAGELPLEALLREAGEEIGIMFDKKDARLVHAMYRAKHDDTGERVDLFFELQKWSGEPSNVEPEKCDDLQWFELNNLPQNIMHHVAEAVDAYLKGVPYSEEPYNEKYLNPNKK